MFKWFIRLMAFFMKEFNEVRRQPRLILSLLLGPFLILVLVGLGYEGTPPPLRVALVVPPTLQEQDRFDQVLEFMEANYTLVSVANDEAPAVELLEQGAVDVVEIVPATLEQDLRAGEQTPVTFIYDTLDPQVERQIQYAAYAQIEELNQIFLEGSIEEVQGSADDMVTDLHDARIALEALDMVGADNPQETRAQMENMSDALRVLAASPAFIASSGEDPDELLQLSEDLEALSQASTPAELAAQRQRIGRTAQRMQALEESLGQLEETPAGVLTSPLDRRYFNQSGGVLDLMTFFAPAVVAFILQHIAVTFGALSLVRERLRGATEFYSVTPVSMFQVLMGKYFAYLLFTGLVTAGLLAILVWALGVPFRANPLLFAAYTALFLVASLSIGFLISVLSRSDTQAVQLAMLVLLLSVFFSGFILPLNLFRGAVRYAGYIVPVTHAQQGFRGILLEGLYPEQIGLAAMSIIALVALLAVAGLWARAYRRAA